MNKPNTPNRIPAEDSEGFTRWEPPRIEDGKIVEAVKSEQRGAASSESEVEITDVEQEVPALTPEKIEEITEQARQQGYQDGFAQGREEGHAEGYEQGHQQGVQQGQDEGREQGLQQGTENARHEIDTRLGELSAVIESLQAPIREHENDIEQALFDIAATIARSVIQRELSLEKSALMSTIQMAVGQLPVGARGIEISLNPDDLEALSAMPDAVDRDWNLIADASIEVGGCIVKTAVSVVEFTVEQRFQQVIDQLLDTALHGEPEIADTDSERLESAATSTGSDAESPAAGTPAAGTPAAGTPAAGVAAPEQAGQEQDLVDDNER